MLRGSLRFINVLRESRSAETSFICIYWLVLWLHWAWLPLSLRSTVISDIPSALTQSEMHYGFRMRHIIDDVLPNVMTYSHALDVYLPLMFDRCDSSYWYQVWADWFDNMSFECRLHHRNKQVDSVFTEWHINKIFALLIAGAPRLVSVGSKWRYDFVEMPPLYATLNPMFIFTSLRRR